VVSTGSTDRATGSTDRGTGSTGRATFDLCGPLPEGTTVLEASAGTGKTYTIAGLAVRYLAEGVARIDEMMLVTFGRAATAELRERVRERLADAVTALADGPAARDGEDELFRFLARADDATLAVRHARLATALANFDAATIATTHGFCHQMLAGLGIAADVDADATFAEATGDLVTEVAGDLYVADYGRPDSEEPPLDFRAAARLANQAVGDRAARLEPGVAEPDSLAGVRVRFAERTRAEVARRKRAMRVMDYDDLLVHLRDALADPDTGEDAAARIRSRYRIVLVDEFQDTDPVQWEILERTFHRHRTLVLIGDPKQAIYAFRGADVVTYLLAKGAAAAEATLGTNWRSDQPLVHALRHVVGDVALGDPRILVHEVAAAHPGRRLIGAPVDAPLRIRTVSRADFDVERRASLTVGQVRPFVADDVAADIVRLLASGAEIETAEGRRVVEPADVAVLVQRNEDGRTVRDAVAALGVPVVLHATTSVFGSAAAHEWRTLLSALEQPQRSGLAHAAALTDFVGWTAADLADADEAALDGLTGRLREWGAVLSERGVAALFETIGTGTGLSARVLSRAEGERDLTDLRHVAQVLHEAATQTHGGTASLVEWLQLRIAGAKDDVEEERSRRLESDAKAVQVLTVHRSKGLEYGVVYAPFLWDRWVPTSPDPLQLHDEAGARVLDVGGTGGPGYDDRKATHLREDAGESLRLAYVAMTRARSQLVLHWAPTKNTICAPLHRMLFGDRGLGGALPDTVDLPTDSEARTRLTALVEASGAAIRLEQVGGTPGTRMPAEAAAAPVLEVRSFLRSLDRAWARTSYSGLTAGLHHEPQPGRGPVASEPELAGTLDEPQPPTSVTGEGGPRPDGSPTSVTGTDGPVSPMTDLPAGAAFGTLVHSVLEQVDFAGPGLEAELVAACEAAGSERFVGVPAAELAGALLPALHTSLGPLADGRRLVDLGVADRLNELDFELPLAGGDQPTTPGDAPTVAAIAELLRAHLPADDPLVRYAEDLSVPVLGSRTLRGFLTGSIDLVLRVGDAQGQPRYLVADYKTNWLGGPGVLTAERYRPEALAEVMRHAHYPLQALLYSVALHRYLRWRQPGYDPRLHLGGVLYLFVRGMCGPDTPTVDGVPHGVFSWAPPAALVTALSDLLHGGDR
jgi:exodeoxyribonuclease V beta subunit